MKHLFLFTIALILVAPTFAQANTSAISVTAPIDASDKQSLQRGAKGFVNYCLNCHSAKYMRYNRLVDIGLTEKQIVDNLMLSGGKIGDTMEVAMNPVDAKKWFGVAPPDLSVEVRARGADWVYAYLRGYYRDNTTATGWNNTVYVKTAMPHILYELQGEQVLNHKTNALELVKPGKLSASEYNLFVADLTNYMAYMAEPTKQSRQHTGWWVLLFLGVLLILAKILKNEYWRDVK